MGAAGCYLSVRIEERPPASPRPASPRPTSPGTVQLSPARLGWLMEIREGGFVPGVQALVPEVLRRALGRA